MTEVVECLDTDCPWAGAHAGVTHYNYCPLCGEQL